MTEEGLMRLKSELAKKYSNKTYIPFMRNKTDTEMI